MSDKASYNFSFSYDLGGQQAASRPPDLYAFDDCLECHLPQNRVLLRSRHTGLQSIVTGDVLYSLQHCTRFKPLDEHVEHLQQVIPELQGHGQDILDVLGTIRQAGLLLSADKKARELNEQPQAPADDTQGICYCILTCDRPEAVRRLLGSMERNHAFDTASRYYLIDDSRTEKNQAANRKLCQEVSNQLPVEFHYFGLKEQQTWLQKLAAELPQHRQGIDFLLGRYGDAHIPSHGRSRNWALLLGSGDKTLLIDDDVLFHRVRAPKTPEGFTLSPTGRSVDFFMDDSQWQELLDEETPDPTAGLFTSALNTTLAHALSLGAQKEIQARDLQGLDASLYHHLGADSRIIATCCGYAKDPGTASNDWIYRLDKSSRRNLLDTPENYKQYISGRNLWMGSRKLAFQNSLTLISGITGIDTSATIPPYFPLYRNEDFLYGELLHLAQPTSVFLDLPWAVPHLPVSERQWSGKLSVAPPVYGLPDFAADFLARTKPSPLASSAEARLDFASQFFSTLGTASDATLAEQITEHTLRLRSGMISRLNEVLDSSADEPLFWQQDLQTIIQAMEKSLLDPVPTGFNQMPAGADGMNMARKLCSLFAEGMQAWGQCMALAKRFRQHPHRP